MFAHALLSLLLATAPSQWSDPPDQAQQSAETLARYVGQDICLTCHSPSENIDGQTCTALSCAVPPIPGHRNAFYALQSKAAKAIALLSGEPALPIQSRICLGCHSAAADEGHRWTMDTYRYADGVQCESCHGPGSRHVQSAKIAARSEDHGRRAIQTLGEAVDCAVCHRPRPSHFEVLDRGFRPDPADGLYKTPVGMAISANGERLYAVCQGSNSLIEIDTRTLSVSRETKVGVRPHAVAISPDNRFLYVTNRLSGTLTVVNAAEMGVAAEVVVGSEPHGVAVAPATGQVFVVNTGDNSLVYVDPQTRQITKRLMMGGSPWGIVVTADSNRAYVTNVRPRLGRFREPPVSELTVVDLSAGVVVARADVPEANMLQGVVHLSASGVTLFTLMRTKNLIPTTQATRGWVVTNGLGVLWPNGNVDQVVLDEPAAGFADVFDIAITADQRRALAVAAGTDEVAIVDLGLLTDIVAQAPGSRRDLLPDLLGGVSEAIVGRVPVGRNPRAAVFAPDGKVAYVANALNDTVSVVDMEGLAVVATIDLAGPWESSEIRRGEMLFHSADSSAGRQFSCRSCHPDGHHNGLTFDIEADGLGMHPSDNRTLQGIFDTPPFKWEGTNPSLHRQCGPRFSVFFTRLAPFGSEDLNALVRYMSTIERPPNGYRDESGLTTAQRRGKEIFERRARNDGTLLTPEQRCVHCHSGAYRTNAARSEVATTMWFDAAVDVDLGREIENTDSFGALGSYYFVDAGIRPKVLDNPHLTNIADGAPYLHNGAANSLEEIWTRFNMTDRHGATADLTRAQLNDLIAYLKAQ